MSPAQPATLDTSHWAEPGTVPVFTAVRYTKEEPDSAPAASLRVRRRHSSQPPSRRFHDSRKFPDHQHSGGGCALLPTRIHQVRVGKALRGFTTSVPRVLLSVPLTGPTPSGSADAPRLCQGCSHPAPASPGPGCPQLQPGRCDDPTVVASHLHSNNSASRRTKPALNAFAITFEGRIIPSTTN